MLGKGVKDAHLGLRPQDQGRHYCPSGDSGLDGVLCDVWSSQCRCIKKEPHKGAWGTWLERAGQGAMRPMNYTAASQEGLRLWEHEGWEGNEGSPRSGLAEGQQHGGDPGMKRPGNTASGLRWVEME